MSLPKGKHPSGQAQANFATQPPRFANPSLVQPHHLARANPENNRGAELGFGSSSNYAAALNAHVQQQASPNAGRSTIPQVPPPTSTPPQQQDMAKAPPHMQQTTLQGNQMQFNYMPNSTRAPQYMPRQAMNSRMAGQRPMHPSNMPQPINYPQVHQFPPGASSFMASNMAQPPNAATTPVFTHLQYPQRSNPQMAPCIYMNSQTIVPQQFLAQTTPFYYTNNQLSLMRPNMMTQQAGAQQQSASHMQPPQQTTAPIQGAAPTQEKTLKRRKHALSITDPSTGKDILEDIMQETTPPRSADSSARQTPQPATGDNNIAAEFAAKVAIAAGASAEASSPAANPENTPEESMTVSPSPTANTQPTNGEVATDGNRRQKGRKKVESPLEEMEAKPEVPPETSLPEVTPAVSPPIPPQAPPTDPVSPNKEEDKMVAAKNEENSRMAPTDPSPAVIEKPVPEAVVKLVYSKDQWSPSNLEGKKKYDRDFLMQLKDDPQSVKRPLDLPKLEVVITDQYKSGTNASKPLGNLNRGPNSDALLMPNFMKSSPRTSAIKRNSQQGKPKAPKVIQLNLSLNEDVKLNETENAWRPNRLTGNNDQGQAEKEELYKKVRSVLNKLTPQKFGPLVEQVKALNIDTEEKLRGVIDLVFEKAVDEPNFSVEYAMMCETLSCMQVVKNKGAESAEIKNFKKLLLMKCQVEFEKQSTSKDELKREERLKQLESVEGERKKELEIQLEEEDRRIRMKYVGVNRFIGELYKRHMLTANIMVKCISKLLETNDEESLECLCKLLTTVGKELENTAEKDKKTGVDLSQHFTHMQAIVDRRNTSSRIRFMLQDVIELRQEKWKPRRGDSKPKTMEEIAKEAERESLSQLAAPHVTRTNKDERDRRRAKMPDQDGWSTAGSGRVSTPRAPLEVNKLKSALNRPVEDVLGNKNQFSWGSQGSMATNKNKVAGQNPYNILSSVDSEKSGGLNKEAVSSAPASRSSSREAPTPSSDASKNLPTSEEQGASEEVMSKKGGAIQLSDDALEDRSKLLLEEYFAAENDKELETCVRDEIASNQLCAMLLCWIQVTLEWSVIKREKTANALIALFKCKIINVTHLLPALDEILQSADDLLIDIPMTYTYLAQLIAPLLRCEVLELSSLGELLSKQTPERAQRLLLECIKLLQIDSGPGWIVSHWQAAQMNWTDYVEPNQLPKFLKTHGLNYFLEGEHKLCTLGEGAMSPGEMQDRLTKLMKDSSYEDLTQWITCNIGSEIHSCKYIRALMTAVCTVGTFQDKSQWRLTNSFHSLSKVIQRFVDADADRELEALYAIQAFVHSLEHPQGLLTSILTTLLEDGILSRDSMRSWVNSKDPAEAEGRGVALKSINQFITWLDEPDDDSDDAS